jgi:hypothetical protein
MRRREFITLVVLSGEEKKARGCDDYVPNPSARANCSRKFAITCNNVHHDCCSA